MYENTPFAPSSYSSANSIQAKPQEHRLQPDFRECRLRKMFGVVRRLFGSAPTLEEPGPEKAIELISLPAGRLNLIKPKHITKVDKECIFLEAALIIRRTSIPFHYQLVITRLNEDDEERSETEDALDDDHEKAFLLGQALDFRVCETVDESDAEEKPTIAFSWLDLSSPEVSERFEFVIQHEYSSTSEIERVEDAIVQCIWEGENEKDSSEAPEEDLLAIKQSFYLLNPQSEISYPAQPLHEFRAPSTTPSDESDIEQPADTTQEYSRTSRASRSPSLRSEHLGVNSEEQDIDDDSDSSADEIVNHLKGTTLTDKSKEPLTSLPISATPSRANPQPPVPSPQRKSGVSFVPHELSPAKAQSPLPSPQRTLSARASSSTHSSGSQESIADEDHEVTHHNPTSPRDETQADSSPFDGRLQDLPAGQDPLNVSLADDDDMSFTGETVCVWKSICNLYLFEPSKTSFERWETGALAELWVSTPDNPQSDICWLTVRTPGAENDNRVVISTPIANEQNLNFSGGSILFNYKYNIPDSEAEYRTWALRFPGDEVSRDQYTTAQEAFAKALYDRDNGLGSYEAQDRATKEWSRLTYGLPLEGVYDEEDSGQSDDSAEEVEEDDEEEEYASSDDDDDAQLQRFRSENYTKNSCHALGAKENLSCVTRGDMMGIFRNESTSDKKLKFIATIPDLTTPDGAKAVHPTKIMLYSQDNIVIIEDSSIPNYLFKLDLGVGKIVEAWKMNDDPLADFFARSKFSPMEMESTLIGASHNKIFKIDPRVDGCKAVAEQTQTYKTKTEFSCGVTSAAGFIAIGANTGEIRLFDPNIGKRAKTLLPQVRDAVKHLDVTNNGRYLVATCEKYLLLYDCQMSGGKLGFEKSFPKSEKPEGIRIELTPEHRALIVHEKIPYCFNQAKFNQGDGEVERKIITAMGPYIIEFDLKSILDKSKRTQYVLKRYQERVVADNFRWGDDKDIVVTLESDVIMEKRNRLSKPNRQSIVGLAPINVNHKETTTSRIRTGGSTLGIVQEWEG